FENPVYRIEEAEPNQPVVNHILEAAEFWLMEMDIDGFRLDVPNEVPFWFWELFRKKVKNLKPDAYIVGEIWHNAREWVNGKYCDAVMNYACFKDPVIKFFNLRRGDAASFDRELKPGLLNYPVQATQVMMNLIDSHDTYRYLEIARGDLTRLQLAVLFQMTYTGVPHIWYGDEIGMTGAHDPDCRRPFNWLYAEDDNLIQLREFYKKLIHLRKTHSCLRRGNFRTVKTVGMLYAYTREFQNEGLLIVINNGESGQQIDLPVEVKAGTYKDLWTDTGITVQEGFLQLNLQPYSFLILESQP
ncbi:MAG: alpha-glucosidase C-terminal domain-containing protein, partial [Candidatus Cloacimonetes bacterium]|nr:alpha-glucosidase C-terminal domain-containing protein [Candidatus Cloacimonadota bacterium]